MGFTIDIQVVTKRYLRVIKLVMGLYYGSLKVVDFIMELHHGSLKENKVRVDTSAYELLHTCELVSS